ncbi:unnamed protein product [Adineta steineri]|uniref:UDENN domain-containing protein n=1 Tax=Adineta steineri TaxID=433720 RepID=A0A815DUA0_9BILA|nr:unnamed protein product [Adineta steineri]CAF3570834.1 unnamed protein product [Adineta steineri]
MHTQNESAGHLVRSGTIIRESVRCLPKGHFQQIRQMFDKQSCSKKPLSTIYERHQSKQQSSSPYNVLKLPVTDDEKLQHTTNIDDIIIENDKSFEENYLSDYPLFHSLSKPIENHLSTGTHSSTTSLPQQFLFPIDSEKSVLTSKQRRQLAMAAAVNYPDSYESSPRPNQFNRIGSTRQYVSSLQRTLAVHAKPILVKTTFNPITQTPSIIYDSTNELFPSSKRLQSSASLSSTGYDSNSSPSILSKRHSLITSHSNDLSTSSDERQRLNPWILYESELGTPITIANSYSSDDVFDSPSSISRSRVKINHSPTSTFERRPVSVVRHTSIRNPPVLNSPSISSTSSTSSTKFIVQTTSFPDSNNSTNEKLQLNDDDSAEKCLSLRRKHTLRSTSSTGFQIQQGGSSTPSPVVVKKQTNEREDSPLPIVENPLFQQHSPPRKPPRTFQHENRYDYLSQTIDQKVPSSSSSSSDSPTFDLGARSASCMDLTVGVSNALLSSGLLPLNKSIDNTNNFTPHENIYEELKTPVSTFNKQDGQQFLYNNNSKKSQTMKPVQSDLGIRTSITKPKQNHPFTNIKSAMKKGISEPNLAKTKSSSFFSPRGLINRFKRILPLSLSKQSLNDSNVMTIDSDDSASTTSENNDDIRISRLDHVSRVKNVYDSLGTGSHMTSLFTEPSHSTASRELKTLYDYVVHILPEQELGYFANGNGCLSLSNLNINHQIHTSTSIRFQYPLDANTELSLKYFCFPDQHDSNNNHNTSLSSKASKPEYFRFTLTDMRGVRQHGYCSRFTHKGILNALCIISPCDMLDLYEKILSTATELFLSYKEEDAKRFLKEIYPHRLPNRGDTIHIHTTTVGLYTLKCDYDRRKQLIDSINLLSLSTDTIIKIFSSILYEQKLIFIGNELGPLTRLINTFICLLYPFSWPHTYVPILPALMLDILQAPTPYIIGILRSCEHYLCDNDEFLSQDNSDILIVDIDHDHIYSINDYLSNDSSRGSLDNLNNKTHSKFQILPKIFKIELKQEISFLRKHKQNLSLDECQQRLRNIFMSIFIQSCYNYKDYLNHIFDIEHFIQSKQHTIELFLEWFTRTQIFELFIRQKLETDHSNQFAITFDLACEKYRRTLKKQIPERITVKSVKRKAAIRANKQDHRL